MRGPEQVACAFAFPFVDVTDPRCTFLLGRRKTTGFRALQVRGDHCGRFYRLWGTCEPHMPRRYASYVRGHCNVYPSQPTAEQRLGGAEQLRKGCRLLTRNDTLK